MSLQSDCLCEHYKPKQRGLPRCAMNQVKQLLQTQPNNIKPEEAKLEVICLKIDSSVSPSNQ